MNITTVKAIKVEETNSYLVKLPKSVYIIDSQIITVDDTGKEIAVKDLSSVKRLNYISKIDYYDTKDGKLSLDEYDKKLKDLTKNAEYYDDTLDFNDLDEEFEYRKFKRDTHAVVKTYSSGSTEIVFEIDEIKLDSGVPFVLPIYFVNGSMSGTYIYNRQSALRSHFLNLMKELQLVDSEDDNPNTYHIPTHSELKYAKVCGKYINFNEQWLRNDTVRGSLEALKTQYEVDLEVITDRVKSKYNITHNTVSLDMAEYETSLKLINSLIFSIDSKISTQNEWRKATNEMTKLMNKFYKDAAKEVK